MRRVRRRRGRPLLYIYICIRIPLPSDKYQIIQMKKWEALGGEEKASSWCTQPTNDPTTSSRSSVIISSWIWSCSQGPGSQRKEEEKTLILFLSFSYLSHTHYTIRNSFLLFFIIIIIIFSPGYYCVIIRIGTTGPRDATDSGANNIPAHNSRKVFCLSECLFHQPRKRFQHTHTQKLSIRLDRFMRLLWLGHVC